MSSQKKASDKSALFEDKIVVHTAPSGTQYVDSFDVLINGDTQQEAKRLRKVFSIGMHKGSKPDR